MRFAKVFAAIAIAAVTSGCATMQNMRHQTLLAESGVQPRFNSEHVEASNDSLALVLDRFENRSGKQFGDNADDNYETFLAASDYIDEQCDSYLEATESYRKYLERAKGYTTATASATDVILAAAGASARAIGITAATFGLASESLEVTKNTLLLQLDASSLRELVSEHQAAYLAYVAENRELVASKASTTKAIRGYLRTCLPSSMRALVNAAVKDAKIEIDDRTGVAGIVNDQPIETATILAQPLVEE